MSIFLTIWILCFIVFMYLTYQENKYIYRIPFFILMSPWALLFAPTLLIGHFWHQYKYGKVKNDFWM
jgi:hypothetical protein